MPKTKSRNLCCLCGLHYERIGNHPAPLAQSGRCCDYCDEIVIEARIDPAGIAMEIERVEHAIMRKLGNPRAMAIAAICASRGPGLLVEKQLQLAKLREG
jgi:hypothetical protein